MKKTTFVMSFLLVFSLFCFISATKASANNKILVGVFYYPWYFGGNQTGHWNGNPQDYGINLSNTSWTVVDEPLLDWYASDNRTVIDQHLAWFAYAGIDFGIISWWGPYVNKTVFDDKWVEVLLNETSNYESSHGSDFKWVVSIEGGSPNESQLLRNWVFVNYTEPYHQIWFNDSENNNKPFLFWMDSDITNDNTTRQSILEDSNFSVKILGQADYSNWKTWTPYTYSGSTVAFPPKEGFMCVMPRYDETRLDPTGYSGTVRDKCADPYLNGTDGNNTDPLNGVPLYDKQWEEVLSNASAGKVQYVGIATWNDFTERTQIEPCYDNTSAYKDNSTFLLDKTKRYISLLSPGAQIVEPHNADAMWIEPTNLAFDTIGASVGTMFNVTVAMNFTEDVFAWQAVMYYNSSQLNCTRVGATAPPTSGFMSGHSTTFSKAINPESYPTVNGSLQAVLAAETCSAADFVPGPHSGTLCWVEFQIILAPGPGQPLNKTLDISTEYAADNVYVRDPTGNSLTFTPFDSFTFVPELGPLMIAIFMISTLAAVILSRNRISKKTRALQAAL